MFPLDAAANSRAVAMPIPLLAPVIRMARLASLSSAFLPNDMIGCWVLCCKR